MLGKILLGIIISSILLLTGCYNYKELNKIAIVSSISIDKKVEKGSLAEKIRNILVIQFIIILIVAIIKAVPEIISGTYQYFLGNERFI